MSARILLVTGSIEDEQREFNINHNSHYPLGLAYLYSYLEKQGHKPDLLFLNDYSPEDCFDIVIENINKNNPEFVGIQIFTNNRIVSYKLINYIHEHFPSIHILVGGIHATAMYEQLLNKFPYIKVIIGEGEITLDELIIAIQNNDDINNVKGIAYSQGGTIIKTEKRELIQDLDSLPFLKHELFFKNGRTMGCLLTSRGCPFGCTFCCLQTISERKTRFRSVENVVAEIEYMIEKFPEMTRIWIHDDTLFLDNKRAIKLCEEIVKKDIHKKLEFVCSGRLKPVTKELVEALEKANINHVLFGLESGAAEILKSSKKAIKKEDAINTFKLFKDSRINVTSFLIVGLPGETMDTIKETVETIQTLQKIKYMIYEDIGVLFIYPGTEISRLATEQGNICDDYWLTDKKVPFYTAENSEEELMAMKNYLLDRISFSRFFTWKGFFAQWKMWGYYMTHKEFAKKIRHKIKDSIKAKRRAFFNKFKKIN